MSRPATFERDTVVRAARTVFWHRGYDASVPELESATGLSRSSIYNTFGSKRGLFDAAVQSYLDDVIRPRLQPLQGEPVAPDAIIAYLTGLRSAFQRPDSMTASSGCLLINTANTPIAQDQHLARVITDYRNELHAALGRGISAHAPQADLSARQHATISVTGLVVAAFALARVDSHQAAQNVTAAIEVVGRLG